MSRPTPIGAWIALLAIVLSGPLRSLSDCLRCPPDCPMHVAAAANETLPQPPVIGAGGGVTRDHQAHEHQAHDHAAHEHAAHEHAAHEHAAGSGHTPGDHGAPPAAGDTAARRCHDASPAPRADDGPCLSGVCGHMDASLAHLLPEAVLTRLAVPAPVTVTVASPARVISSPARLPVAPPTRPPAHLFA